MTLTMMIRGCLLLLSGFGSYAGGRLSISHFQHGEVCPLIAYMPACIIVFFGYSSIFLSSIIYRKTWSKKLFYIGWTPVFLLALFGVIVELTKGHICPPGPMDIPQCFFSLLMAVMCWVFFQQFINRLSKDKV